MSLTRRDVIMDTIVDLVSDFLWYDRREDEKLPIGAIEAAVAAGEITWTEVVGAFHAAIEERLTTMNDEGRCVAGVDNARAVGGGIVLHALNYAYDRCRRRAGHVDGSTLGRWHLPDCGGAFADNGTWVDDWITIFDAVVGTGEKIVGWPMERLET